MNDAPNTKEAKQPRDWGPWKILIPALILLCAGGTLGLVLRMPGKIRQNPTTEAPPVNVEVEVVAPLPELADTFELPAVVEANRVVTVSAEVEGRIERVVGEDGIARTHRREGCRRHLESRFGEVMVTRRGYGGAGSGQCISPGCTAESATGQVLARTARGAGAGGHSGIVR